MSQKKLSDFAPQRKNANKHTPRGMGMLDNAIAKHGWISAITTAADGETIDGSARLETACDRFGEDVEPIIIRSKGDRPIIHIREDIPNAEDDRAKLLSIEANRIAQVNLDIDLDILREYSEEVDLSHLYFEDELESLLNGFVPEPPALTTEEEEKNAADLIEKAESGQIESRVKRGEVWALGRHRLYCGDSTDGDAIAKYLDGYEVDMCWSDAPYGISIVATNEPVGGGEAYDIPFGGVKNREKGYVGGG